MLNNILNDLNENSLEWIYYVFVIHTKFKEFTLISNIKYTDDFQLYSIYYGYVFFIKLMKLMEIC